MLILWLIALFVSFGLFAPPNFTVVVSLFVAAGAACGVILLDSRDVLPILWTDSSFECAIASDLDATGAMTKPVRTAPLHQTAA
jgi:hypothetical protein